MAIPQLDNVLILTDVPGPTVIQRPLEGFPNLFKAKKQNKTKQNPRATLENSYEELVNLEDVWGDVSQLSYCCYGYQSLRRTSNLT